MTSPQRGRPITPALPILPTTSTPDPAYLTAITLLRTPTASIEAMTQLLQEISEKSPAPAPHEWEPIQVVSQ